MRKPTEHDYILDALYEASRGTNKAMDAEMWQAKIQSGIRSRHGFYPEIHQVRYALQKMSKRGDMLKYYHERGWYRWYTYKWNADSSPF